MVMNLDSQANFVDSSRQSSCHDRHSNKKVTTRVAGAHRYFVWFRRTVLRERFISRQ